METKSDTTLTNADILFGLVSHRNASEGTSEGPILGITNFCFPR